jgi:hypothetical protein
MGPDLLFGGASAFTKSFGFGGVMHESENISGLLKFLNWFVADFLLRRAVRLDPTMKTLSD